MFELFSSSIAVRALIRGAKRKGWSVWRFIRRSPDLTMKTVFFEDTCRDHGALIAATGLTVSELAHDEVWDGIASVSIGFVLAAVSIMLGMQARNLLLGAAASEEVRESLRQVLTRSLKSRTSSACSRCRWGRTASSSPASWKSGAA